MWSQGENRGQRPSESRSASFCTRNHSEVAPNEAKHSRGVNAIREGRRPEPALPDRAEERLAGVRRGVGTDESPGDGGKRKRREEPDAGQQERVIGRHRSGKRLDPHAMVEAMGDAPPRQLGDQRQQPEDGKPGPPPT